MGFPCSPASYRPASPAVKHYSALTALCAHYIAHRWPWIGSARGTRPTCAPLRPERGWTLRDLAERAGLSPASSCRSKRRGNISVRKLASLAARAGHDTGLAAERSRRRARASCDCAPGTARRREDHIGRRLARRLQLPFVELDRRVEEAAGLTLDEIFAFHGEEYYRRLERESLDRVLRRRAVPGAGHGRGPPRRPTPSRCCGGGPHDLAGADPRTIGIASCNRATGGRWPTTRRRWPSCGGSSRRAGRSTRRLVTSSRLPAVTRTPSCRPSPAWYRPRAPRPAVARARR